VFVNIQAMKPIQSVVFNFILVPVVSYAVLYVLEC